MQHLAEATLNFVLKPAALPGRKVFPGEVFVVANGDTRVSPHVFYVLRSPVTRYAPTTFRPHA